jgi:outer membrane biogenesis lipoprotein LolB
MMTWFWIFLLGLGFFLPSCATIPILPPETPDPQDLLTRVQDRGQQIQGLKGLARVRVSAPGKNYSGPEVLWARRPSFLRLESLGPLGTPQLYMTTDGQAAKVYIPAENRYYQGLAQGRLLSMALPVVLPPADLVSIILGDCPGPKEEAKASIRRDEEGNRWILDLLFSLRPERQTLWIDPNTFHVLRAEIERPGLSYELTFRDFQTVKGLRFPRRIEWIVPGQGISIAVIWEEIELNPGWAGEDFILPVPRGATVMPWE